MRKIWSEFVDNFFRGLVFVAPVMVTVLIISMLLNWVRSKFSDAVGPLWGLLIIVSLVLGIALIGIIGNLYIGKPIAKLIEKGLARIPLVNTIYSSTKDMVNSFFGENKKFDKPVLVVIDKVNNIEKLGFITQQSLENFGLEDRVAVYCPISYSVAGDLFIVRIDQITFLDVSSADIMRFLISGGLTDPEKSKTTDHKKSSEDESNEL